MIRSGFITLFKFNAHIIVLIFLLGISCTSSNKKMSEMLKNAYLFTESKDNFFAPRAKARYYDSLILIAGNNDEALRNRYFKAYFLLQAGELEQAIEMYESLLKEIESTLPGSRKHLFQYLGLAYLRLGEQANCVTNHQAESCIFPIQGTGVHRNDEGSRKASGYLEKALQLDSSDLESRWLLNIAYMTLGQYPTQVPKQYLIPHLLDSTSSGILPFHDISGSLGLTYRNMSGGVIIEDFNLDGNYDIVTSAWGLDEPMHFWINKGDGTLSDQSAQSGLDQFTGGLNMMQTDFNNDGYPDIFVLRGGWMGIYGRQPNSLLKNNQDGTFTDVTIEAGLLSFYPTQTATWNDFNNDGWLDVFIGNESSEFNYPCELYINNHDGTFRNESVQAGTALTDYVKGVTSGDYDNDGWPDLFISTMNRRSYLFHNEGMHDGHVVFQDRTSRAGFEKQISKTFPTWFWDFDNDGRLDILLCSYEFEKSLAHYEAAERLGRPLGEEYKLQLYRNSGDGTFTNIASEVGLDKTGFAMGSNFGDINNDGYPDIYLGTGNPDTRSLIPNKMFLNENGKRFTDVTSAARLGHLQKGHGVSFADIDNDGDQDIFLEVGGAFEGEKFQNALYLNPGQTRYHWLSLKLKGMNSNALGVGSRVRVVFQDGSLKRTVYKDLNSGGSFGASPLLAHLGLGDAAVIDTLEIRWSGSNFEQLLTNIPVDQQIEVTEGNSNYRKMERNPLPFH